MPSDNLIRAVDIGGAGARKSDINLKGLTWSSVIQGSPEPFTVVVDDAADKPGAGYMNWLLNFITSDLPKGTVGISLSIAGSVKNGVIVSSPNAKAVENVDIASIIGERTGFRTIIRNDMTCAVHGMAAFLEDEPRFLGITLSSGIGAKIWDRGRIQSEDVEPGHICLDRSTWARLCGCSKRGCAEAYLGGHVGRDYIRAEAKAAGVEIHEEPWKILDRDFLREEKWAVDFYNNYAAAYGALLASIRSSIEFPLVVMKGTIAQCIYKLDADWFEKAVRAAMADSLGMTPYWADEEHLRFMLSPDPMMDALVGAAGIWFNEE